MNKDEKDTIQQIIKQILEMIGLKDCQITVQDSSDILIYNIQIDDPSLLIGRGGENLLSFQHIIYLLVSAQLEEIPRFVIDVNNYREKQKDKLEYIGKQTADKVIERQRSEILRPMSSYQRKIIHNTIANYNELSSVSIGEEPNRRVLVKFK